MNVAAAIQPFDIEFVGGRVLNVAMTVLFDLTPVTYRFNPMTGGALTWRLDLHAGHEAEHGGPSHLHVGPTQSYRIAHRQVALVDVADRVHRTSANSNGERACRAGAPTATGLRLVAYGPMAETRPSESDSMLAQVEALRGVLNNFADVPVSGVLCFIGADWGLFGPRKVKKLNGVTMLWPLKLPDFVSAPGTVDVAATAAYLRDALKPAR